MFRSTLTGLLAALFLPTVLHAAPAPPAPKTKPASMAVEHAYFAMGCFWCGESDFEGRPGIKSVTSGYTGGPVKHPTYEQVSSGTTGHFESVDIAYDPAQISYAKLLDIFWHSVDPTQSDGQFCDRGPQYRSAIFYRDSTEAKAAYASKRAIEKSGVLKKPIVTLIVPAGDFWPAEAYHQNFCQNNPEHYQSYREGCRRDQRLAQVWGKAAAKPSMH